MAATTLTETIVAEVMAELAELEDPDTSKRNHVRQLEALGYAVTLTAAA